MHGTPLGRSIDPTGSMPVSLATAFRGCACAAAAAIATIAGPVSAQVTAYAAGQMGNPTGVTSIPLQIQVQASVGGRCGFAAGNAPSGTRDQRDFDVTGFTFDFPFQLDCTGPSRVAVVSTNGGLKTAGSVPTGYATLAPYDVTLNLVGASTTVNATCAVASLSATATATCTTPFRGPASTALGLRLPATSVNQNGSFLRASAPAFPGPAILAAGEYADTLVVTVSAAP
jgi:hypothetical protein